MQDFALVEKYTVKQNINIPLIYTDKPINKEKAINDVLKSVGLSDKQTRLPTDCRAVRSKE